MSVEFEKIIEAQIDYELEQTTARVQAEIESMDPEERNATQVIAQIVIASIGFVESDIRSMIPGMEMIPEEVWAKVMLHVHNMTPPPAREDFASAFTYIVNNIEPS